MNQYITDYKGEEDQNIKEIGDLTIDYNPDDFDPIEYSSESFLTSFGNITHEQASNMSTELANHSFMHAIAAKETTKEPTKEATKEPTKEATKETTQKATKEAFVTREITITKEEEQDPFAYINTLAQYTFNEFYSVMIDTRASCRLTAGYKQYLAYKKTNDIKIDTI